jgi:hypothetical protein
MIKDLIDQRSKSPLGRLKLVVNQILKGHYRAFISHCVISEGERWSTCSKREECQKRTRSTRQIAHEGGPSIEEGLQLAQQPIQPVEADKVVSHKEVDLPNQPIQPARRAPPTCSGCGVTGHRITLCKNRVI